MDPQYFKKELTWSEAVDYMEGLERRYWSDWQRTRLEANVVAHCTGNKKDAVGELSFEKRMRKQSAPKEEEIDEAREWARKLEATLAAKKKE